MMNEPFDDERLSAYYDGEIAPAEQEAVREQVEASPKTQRELEEIGKLSAWIKELPGEHAPVEFRSRVMQAAERSMLLPMTDVPTSASRPSRRHVWWLGGAATVLASAAMLFVMTRGSGPTEQSPQAFGVAEGTLGLDVVSRKDASRSILDGTSSTFAMGESADADDSSVDAPKSAFGQPVASAENLDANAKTAAAPSLANTPASGMTRLEFNEDLKRPQIGAMVQALERRGENVSVVTLQVVDVQDGLENLRVLLARNDIPPAESGQTRRFLEETESDSDLKSREKVEEGLVREGVAEGRSSDQLVCVLVETDDELLTAALWELSQQPQFHELNLEAEPVELALLDAYLPEFKSGSSHRDRIARARAQPSPASPTPAEAPADESAPSKKLRKRPAKTDRVEDAPSKPGSQKASKARDSESERSLGKSNGGRSSGSSAAVSRQSQIALPSDALKTRFDDQSKDPRADFGRRSKNKDEDSVKLNRYYRKKPSSEPSEQPGKEDRSALQGAPGGPVRVLIVLVAGTLDKPAAKAKHRPRLPSDAPPVEASKPAV